ncbi:MAG: hypothetical protein RL226_677 [Bacteroidota bacterium]|jgi:hypothetical protein
MKLLLVRAYRSIGKLLFKKSIVLPVLGTMFIFASGEINTHQTKLSSHRDSKANGDSIKAHFDVAIQNWDIVFQTSRSDQSVAIQLATNSKYSHCGLIYRFNDQLFVLEAIEQVRMTPFEEWVARGAGGHFIIKRLKNSEGILTPETLEKMKREGERLRGKDYDVTFEWNDNRMYCSELVWKVYKRGAELELGRLQKLTEFSLSNELVKEKLKERYGSNIPQNELIISPAAIFNSKLLETIHEN